MSDYKEGEIVKSVLSGRTGKLLVKNGYRDWQVRPSEIGAPLEFWSEPYFEPFRPPEPELQPGDRVRHETLGEGTVEDVAEPVGVADISFHRNHAVERIKVALNKLTEVEPAAPPERKQQWLAIYDVCSDPHVTVAFDQWALASIKCEHGVRATGEADGFDPVEALSLAADAFIKEHPPVNDFYEPDEPIEDIRTAFDRGVKGVTVRPSDVTIENNTFDNGSTPEPEAEDVSVNGDVRCPNDGEMVNVRCWKCRWERPKSEPKQRTGAYGRPIPPGDCGTYWADEGGEHMCHLPLHHEPACCMGSSLEPQQGKTLRDEIKVILDDLVLPTYDSYVSDEAADDAKGEAIDRLLLIIDRHYSSLDDNTKDT